MRSATPLLEVDHLNVRFGASTVVKDVSFAIAPGEKFALVGESGSGKSITALSVLRLVDAATSTGAIRFDGVDLMTRSERQMRGRDRPANYSEAARYFAMAADRDHDAAFNLATVYQAGAAGWGAQGGGAGLGRRPGVSLGGWH